MAQKIQTVEGQVREAEKNIGLISNREYQSSVFTSYFGISANAAKLYAGLEQLEKTGNRDDAIKEAMKASVRQGIMTDFIQEHGSEVRNMLFTEFNLKDALEVWKEEGREQGGDFKLIEQTVKKVRKGKSPEVIADELETDIGKIQLICAAAKEYAPDYNTEAIFWAMDRLVLEAGRAKT